MKITLDSSKSRRFCYIDRYENYLTLDTKDPEKSEGLIYKNQTLLLDFCVFVKEDGYKRLFTRFSNTRTDVRPESFLVDFCGCGLKITCGLFENAIFFRLKDFRPKDFDLVLLPSQDLAKKLDKEKAFSCTKKAAVSKPLISDLMQLTRVFGKRAANARLISFDTDADFYISLDHSPSGATKNAARLLKEDGYGHHIQKIHALLQKTNFSSGKKKYDEALEWGKFSSLQFLNGNKTKALWAGLPWFRDYWGRDIFVSVPGTLLLSGAYEEAASLFESFIKFQDTNPHSTSYGRLPNIYRGSGDVIYNTADASLWFVRSALETARFTGSKKFLERVWPAVNLAIECDRNFRTDTFGFLLHGDADTWMDARIFGEKSFSPRGNRACDIQVLWWTALKCGAEIARILGHREEEEVWKGEAKKVKASFLQKFFNGEKMADCLLRDEAPDFRVRPNQLMLVTVPKITGEKFIPQEVEEKITGAAVEELLFPYGITSLSQKDRFFHPYHNTSPLYHEDAAYHNGTIWTWNCGFTIGALCFTGNQNLAWALAKNISGILLDDDVAGTLSANISAYPNGDGTLNFSGAYSSLRSCAEFVRAAWQYFLGMEVNLLCRGAKKISFSPRIPDEWGEGSASIELEEKNPWRLTVKWSAKKGKKRRLDFSIEGRAGPLEIEVEFEGGVKKLFAEKDKTLSAQGAVIGSGKDSLHFAEPLCLKPDWEKPECLKTKNFLAEIALRQEFNGSHPNSLTSIRG